MLQATPRGALSTLLTVVVLWGYIRFLAPSRTEIKILRLLSPSVDSAIVPNACLLESQIYLTQRVYWEIMGALICFTSIFVFSKETCCSDPQSHTCPLFTKQNKVQRHCARWSIKVLQNPQIPEKLAHSEGLDKLAPY